jgi:hypothetical protein
LVWYYDCDEIFILKDIYHKEVCRTTGRFYPFRLESKNRYSGILYDKLRHLLNYAYLNILYDPIGGVGDVLFYYTFRLLTNGQYKIIKETPTKYVTVNYLRSSVIFNYIYFIAY